MGTRRLSNDDVIAIRSRWQTRPDSMAAIARDYSVSDMTIYKVVMNLTYKNLPLATCDHVYQPDNATLTADEIRVIRRALRIGKASIAQIARDFGVSPTQIRRVLSGENWAHIR